MVEQILQVIRSVPQRAATKLVAIDGRGGSGKSMLARSLREYDPRLQIVHIDSFPATAEESPFDPLGTQTQISCARVIEQVLKPLTEGKAARYRASPWWVGQELSSDEEVITAGGTVLIEGCYALRHELRHLYDYKIWVECSPVVAMERALRRDGGEKDRVVWEQVYAPNESGYVGEEEPDRCADMIVDTNGADLLVKTNW